MSRRDDSLPRTMDGLGLTPLGRRIGAIDGVAAGAAVLYAAAIVWAIGWGGIVVLLALLAAPALAAPVLLLRRAATPSSVRWAYGWIAACATAVLAGFFVLVAPIVALVIPGLAVAAVICARHPVPAVVATFVLTGTFGSLTAFGNLPAGESVDVLLGGLWLACLWGWVVGGRERAAWLWPSIAGLGAYVLFTAGTIFTAESTFIGAQGFRASIWYLSALLLVAYAPWPPGARRRMVHGVVAASLAVGTYAVVRWVFGPAAEERALAMELTNNFLDENLRPIGSFTSAKELAAWCALTLPFSFAIALTTSGRRRLVAIAAVTACAVAMLSADVRAGPSAAVPGLLVVLALYVSSRAFRTRRAVTVVVAFAGIALLAVGGFALTLGNSEDSERRYGAILEPGSDASYRARTFKWASALDEIEQAPLGHGLGSAGRVHERYGRFRTVASLDVDNSYLKIALEQGFGLMLLFAAMLVALAVGLARRAVASTHADRAGVAIGALGTLTALVVLFFIGVYIEGLPALAAWIMIGLGVSQFVWRDPDAATA